MRIAKLDDRFKIKLGDITVVVSPLSGRQKIEMTSMIRQGEGGKFFIDKPSQEHYLIKHSVKGIEGLKDFDDSDYQLKFSENGKHLTDDCAEELLGFLANTMFTYANTQAVGGVFGDVMNPFSGEKLEGISVERVTKEVDEKK
jgi:hypothetical protein